MGIQAIEKYNIANAIPVGEERSFSQIAENINLDEEDTTKIIRQAMTLHIFHEPRKGYVAHTSISRQIADNPLLRDWIAFMCNECWRAAPRIVDAMTKWPASKEPGHTAWVLANNASAPLTQEIFNYPERLQRIPGAMQIAGQHEGFHPSHLINDLDWTGVQTFVDMGGAHGAVSIEVVRRVPSVKCIVQDMAPIVASATAPADMAGRLEFMPHDFFGPQVVKGADIYFFRWIFHDWSDKYAVRILQNLIPALKRGARIVANDNLLPEPGLLSPYQERPLRYVWCLLMPYFQLMCNSNFDLTVKQMVNGKERDAEGWAALFKAADARFRLQSIRLPIGARLAIIEVAWDGESQC